MLEMNDRAHDRDDIEEKAEIAVYIQEVRGRIKGRVG